MDKRGSGPELDALTNQIRVIGETVSKLSASNNSWVERLSEIEKDLQRLHEKTDELSENVEQLRSVKQEVESMRDETNKNVKNFETRYPELLQPWWQSEKWVGCIIGGSLFGLGALIAGITFLIKFLWP